MQRRERFFESRGTPRMNYEWTDLAVIAVFVIVVTFAVGYTLGTNNCHKRMIKHLEELPYEDL